MLDGRTRDGVEGLILREIDSAQAGKFWTTIFWITHSQTRACAAARLIERDVIEADNSHGYPTIMLCRKQEAE